LIRCCNLFEFSLRILISPSDGNRLNSFAWST
jgi:hypothetical protein